MVGLPCPCCNTVFSTPCALQRHLHSCDSNLQRELHVRRAEQALALERAAKIALETEAEDDESAEDRHDSFEDPDLAIEQEILTLMQDQAKTARLRDTAITTTQWREQLFMPDAHVQRVKQDVGEYCNTGVEMAAKQVAARWGIPAGEVQQEIAPCFDDYDKIRGSKKEKGVADAVIDPVYPVVRPLGTRRTDKGELIEDTMIDVPVEGSFAKMMSDPANLTDAYRHRPDFDGVVRDVQDGTQWRNHPLHKAAVLGGFVAWMFLLYIDECELCCPIGAFRGNHKYMFGYWVLLNLSSHRRWRLSNIQLAFIVRGDLFAMYGACDIISGVLICLSVCSISSLICITSHNLSLFVFLIGTKAPDGTWKSGTSFMASMHRFCNGIVIPGLDGEQYGSLLIAIADGKGGAELMETKKAVSDKTERICRHCNCTSKRRSEVHSFLDPECPLSLTSTTSHNRDHGLIQEASNAKHDIYSKLLGQSGKPHAFVRSEEYMEFDYIGGMPGDNLMHGELEGLLPLDFRKTMRHLFQSKPTDPHYHPISLNGGVNSAGLEASFNVTISDFDYSVEAKADKPKPLKKRVFEADGSVTWTAAMMLTFALNASLLLMPHVDVTDPVVVCFFMHCHYFAYAWTKEAWSWDDIVLLDNLIIAHHQLYAQIWPDNIIPKFHWVLHLPMDIWRCGPPKHITCMRCEAKHQYFKRLVSQMNWIGDVANTLGRRHSRHLALELHLAKSKPTNLGPLLVLGCTVTLVLAMDMPSALKNLLLQVPSVLLRLQNYTGAVDVVQHTKWKYFGQILAHGSTILFENERGEVCVAEVVRLFEVAGVYIVSYRQYNSSLLIENQNKILPDVALCASELALELNTRKLSIAHKCVVGKKCFIVHM